jgi:NAD(P)-dependent dehydrogenase (short-subunit alcohol dehydrogenase family)
VIAVTKVNVREAWWKERRFNFIVLIFFGGSRMPSGNGRTLITGASTGIGLELAREFASHGHPVILVARNEPRLNEVARQLNQAHHVEATVIPCDLGKPNGPLELFAAVGQRNLRVDILVNNAGVMTQALSRTPRRISCLVWCGSTWRP